MHFESEGPKTGLYRKSSLIIHFKGKKKKSNNAFMNCSIIFPG